MPEWTVMHRQVVASSDIESIGYDERSHTLEIAFLSGGIYQYYGVPVTEYHNLMNAASHGRYFHAFIKDQYTYKRIF